MENKSSNISLELERASDMARAGNYEEAFLLLDMLVRGNAQHADTWAVRAFVNAHQGNRAAAIVDWSKAIALYEEPHYFYMRGTNLFQLGEFREAIADFTRVIQLCDVYKSDYYRGPAYFFRADAHLRLMEFDEAESDCTHVRDDMQTWTDRLRTKAEILAGCAQK